MKSAPTIITRDQAVSSGLRLYFDGVPCKNGSISERKVSNFQCLCDPCKAGRRAADRDRYAKNPDKKKQSASIYYKLHAESVCQSRKAAREANPDANKDQCRKWAKKNPTYEVDRYASDPDEAKIRSKRWRDANALRAANSSRNWRKSNPDKHAAQVAKRRAARIQATPKWLTDEDRAAMCIVYANARRISIAFGIPYHVDHIVPLKGKTVCGLHVPWNLRAIPANDNMRKSNKLDDSVCLSGAPT